MSETAIQGHRVRLLSSRQAPGVLLHTWEDLGKPVGTISRVGVMATIQPGQVVTAEPFMPWADTYAAGYVASPICTRAARLVEATRQEQERAAVRAGGPVQFEQVRL